MNDDTTPKETVITLNPAGSQFTTIPGRSLLESGLSQGIALPYGCANGSCGSCRARLLQGQIHKFRTHDFTLTEVGKLRGEFLLCSCIAQSDCVIEVMEASNAADLPRQELQARLCRLETLEQVTIAEIKFTRGRALRFLPGQQVHLSIDGALELELPIASCPCNAHILEFHLSLDRFSSTQLHSITTQLQQLSTRARIQVSGPSGNFTLSHDSMQPKVFIANGGGFARLQGLIEQVINLDLERPYCLLWQANTATGHYLHNLCRSWHDAIDEFDYFSVEAEVDPLSELTDVWRQRLPSAQVYLDRFDQTLIAGLTALGVRHTQLFYPL